MAVKIALAVGLFIVICVSPGLTSSQVVPDGLVYTEVKKTLVRGVKGVLTCRFHGDPLAVYWRKGIDPDDLSPVVVWSGGEVYGPRYDDGSCDVDENYSLIIKNVSAADARRMYCTVSNNKGPPMTNYTDTLVVDTAITTNQQVTLQLRQATYGTLQCTVHIMARSVSWKKGNESLVVIENNKNAVERSGAGYDDGTYNITQDYSLVIKGVQIHHEGLYVCEVTDDTGISFRNHTFFNVIAQPLKPFPTIQECFNTKQHDPNYCTLVANFIITLTCEVIQYYPDMTVFFLHDSKIVEPLNEMEFNNRDGTKNKTVTIAASDTDELYICVASNIPGIRGNKSSSVLLHYGANFQVAVVVIFVIAASTLTLFVTWLIWRKRHPQKDFQALEKRINDAVMQHYRGICDLILYTKCPIQTDTIRNQNITALFNTSQMLIDCRECRTSKRIKKTIDKENEPAYAWPSNEELETISRQLTQASMKNICMELKIDSRNDEANDEGERLEMLSKWRTGASCKPLWETWKQLFSVLESIHLGGLLPTLKGPYIYKAELVDFAFNLLMHDLCPVIEQLDINATKLVSYRPVFSPSHLDKGTIKLLIELFASIKSPLLQDAREDDLRFNFYSKLENLHYRNVAITGLFEYDMSYGELCSVSEAIHKNTEGRTDQVEEVRKLSSQNVEASSRMLPGPEIPEELGILTTVLQLTDQDIADRLHTSNPLTAYALVKMWKKKPRPSVFYYRGTLANELRRNGMPGLADEIIAGKFITVQTSLAFIEDMVQGLNQDQIRSLGELLQLSGDEQHWHKSTPFKEITKQIYDWVAGWSTGIEGSWRNNLLQVTPETKETARKHRDLNDKLVEHGFLDLAREIMIIEQQLTRL